MRTFKLLTFTDLLNCQKMDSKQIFEKKLILSTHVFIRSSEIIIIKEFYHPVLLLNPACLFGTPGYILNSCEITPLFPHQTHVWLFSLLHTKFKSNERKIL